MKKLLLLAIAAMAVAIPSFAVAESTTGGIFTHEGVPVEGTTEVVFSGPAQFTAGGGGVACTNIEVVADLFPEGTGEVTDFKTTHCTTIGTNFPTHATPENLHWKLQANPNGTVTISGMRIHNSVRHPLDTSVEIGTNVLHGTVTATLVSSTKATLGNAVGDVKVTPLGGGEANAEVSGELTVTDTEGNHTEIGVE